MRNRTIIGAAALAALIGGCQRQDEATEPVANGSAETGISYQQQLRAMPVGLRNVAFIRAIRDAGLECQHVDQSAAAPDHRGMPVWNVRCQGGANWTIVVGENGIAQILNANEARLLEANESGGAGAR